MAAATTALIVGASVAAAAGGAQAIGGAVRAKRAKRDMENFQQQEIADLSANLGKVSTLGADLEMASAAETEAQGMQAIVSGGAQTVLGGIGKLQANKSAVAQRVGAGLDQKMVEGQQRVYQEKVRQFNVQEGREQRELAGMAQERAAGQQQVQAGIAAIGGAAAGAASGYAGAVTADKLPIA
jgi:hypothetical protein